MANKRIIDLSAQGTGSDSYYIEVDDAGFAATKKMTRAVFLSDESTARSTNDAAIIAGAGLDGSAAYITDEASNYLKAADFAAVPLGQSLFNADLLLDAKIKTLSDAIAGIGTLSVKLVLIDEPEIRSLNTNPVTLVAAPGADYAVNIVDCVAYLDYGTAAINVGTNTLDVRYSGGTTIGTFSNAFIESGADAIQKIAHATNVAVQSNAAVQLYCGANDSVGTTTSDLYVWLLYYVIDLTAFTEEA